MSKRSVKSLTDIFVISLRIKTGNHRGQNQLILDKSELVLLFFSQHALEGGIVAHITKQRLSPVRTIEHVIHGIACCDLAMLVP